MLRRRALSRLPPRRAHSQAEAVAACREPFRLPLGRQGHLCSASPCEARPALPRLRHWIRETGQGGHRPRLDRARPSARVASSSSLRSCASGSPAVGRVASVHAGPCTGNKGPPLNTPPHRLLCGPAPTVRKGLVVKAKVRLRPYTSSVAHCVPTLDPSPCNMYRSGIILGLRCPQVMSPDTH